MKDILICERLIFLNNEIKRYNKVVVGQLQQIVVAI